MVQQYVSPVRVYKYPFEVVVAAYNRRFPKSPRVPLMVNSVILEETASDIEEKVVRRCQLRVDAPYIMKRISGIDATYFIQTNTLNWKSRRLHILVKNETFASRVFITEICIFSVHPDNPNWTSYEQEASIEFHSFFGFENQAERLAMDRYMQQVPKGKQVMEGFIADLMQSKQPIRVPYSEPREKVVDSRRDRTTNTPHKLSDEAKRGHKGASSVVDLEKLDAEYIQRFLGALTPKQESNLIQLRQKFATQREKIPNDAVLVRFLRARDFNLDKTWDMLCRHLAWRKQYQVDRLLECWEPPGLVREYYTGGWHYHDLKGHPVYIVRLGQMDVKGLLRTAGEADLLKQVLAHEEAGLRQCEEATKMSNKPISTVTVICDMEGVGLRHLWRPGLRALDRIIQVVEANYPETMGRLLVVRAPRIFPLLWALVSPFIDENTREKIVVYGGNDFRDAGGLSEYIADEYIPDFLGGPCTCSVPAGGVVPKEFYREKSSEGIPSDDGCALESPYTVSSVTKEKSCEIVVWAGEESFLMWDFDVARGRISFSVLRLCDPNQQSPRDSDSFTLRVPSSGQAASDSLSYDSGIDISDAQVVLEPVVHNETDSVQGTLTCQHPGYYILRWQLALDTSSPQASLTDRLWPKATVMHYHEVITQQRVRGSLCSHDSWQSAVSSLSDQEACSSALSTSV